MALNGALAGLVAITAEPLTPTPLMATIVGAIGGLIVVAAIIYIDKAKIDDPVGASLVVWLAIKGIMGIRVDEEEELEGVDVAECGLAAYPEFTKD